MKDPMFVMNLNAMVEARIDGLQFSRYDAKGMKREHDMHLADEKQRIAATARWLKDQGGVSATMSLRILGPITVYPDGHYDLR